MWNNLNTLLSSIIGVLSAELINMLSTINQSSGAVNMYLPVQCQLCVMLQKLWLIPSNLHILCHIYLCFIFGILVTNSIYLLSRQCVVTTVIHVLSLGCFSQRFQEILFQH